MKTDGGLRPGDLVSDTPPPEELAELANAVEAADPERIAALKRDLERAGSVQDGQASTSAWPPLLEEPRRRMDTRRADPATSHRPYIGPVLVAAKRTFRFAFQPFINEVLRRQVEFNEALLTSLAALYEQVRVNARTQALWRKEVEERLKALEEAARNAGGRRGGTR